MAESYSGTFSAAKDLEHLPGISLLRLGNHQVVHPHPETWNRDCHVVEASNVRVIGPFYMPVLDDHGIGVKDHIISEDAFRSYYNNPWKAGDQTFDIRVAAESIEVKERAILIGGWAVWYHWVLNWLPKIHALSLALKIDPKLAELPLAINREVAHRPAFMELLYKMYGRTPRLIEMAPHLDYKFDRLVMPSVLPTTMVTPEFLSFSRSRLITDSKAPSRRIFISRQGGGPCGRRIVNWHDAEHILKKHGFEEKRLENLSLDDQLKAISGSDFVVGTHGSGLTNVMFARPGGQFIEIGGFKRTMFSLIAETTGLRARDLLSLEVHRPSHDRDGLPYDPLKVDYLVDLEVLDSMLAD